MRHYHRCILFFVLALAFSGCRGSGVPSAIPQVALPSGVRVTSAANIAFEPIGPTHMQSSGVAESGKVNALAVDPSNPKVIYTASGRGTGLETYSSAGIYGTTDGGSHWRPLDTGLTDPSGFISSVVNALWLDPAQPHIVLAATEYGGIFRSTDGGASWSNVFRTTLATQFVAYGGVVYASTAAGILASRDDGAMWKVQLGGTATRYPRALDAVNGSAGKAFFAGMSDGTMYALVSGTWTKTGTLPYTSKTGTDGSQHDVHQVAIDPLAPSTIYASENDGRWDQDLYASTDGGHHWTKVAPYLSKYPYYDLGLGTQAIAFSQVHPHQLYVGQDGLFYFIVGDGSSHPPLIGITNLSVIDIRDAWVQPNGKDDRCWIASDQGLDDVPACSTYFKTPMDDVVSKTVATGLARRFIVSPNGQTVVVSLQDFDSHETFDGGATWSADTKGFSFYEDGFNELKPGNANICYVFDEATGFEVSTNGCHSYASPSRQAKKLFSSRLMTTPIAFDSSDANRIYLAVGSIVGAGLPVSRHGVFTTSDNGVTFRQLAWPLDYPGMIVVDQRNAQHILVGDLNRLKASSIEVTSNGGKTWTTSAGVPPTAFWYATAISPVNGKVVLATSVDASSNVFVLRSADGGLHFKKIAVVTNAPLLRGPIDPDLRRDAPQLPPAYVYSPARQILFNPSVTQGTSDVVLTTLNGAYLSTNLGGTWRRLDGNLITHSFWGIRWNAGYLYLGSDGQGVVKSTSPVQ